MCLAHRKKGKKSSFFLCLPIFYFFFYMLKFSFVRTYWIYVASCYPTTSKSECLKVVGKSAHFVWWCRAILAPVVICDIKATLFLSTLATNSDLWQPAWQPALNLAVRHRLVSFGAHEPERQGGEADVKRFSPLMERLGARECLLYSTREVKSISP